MLDKLHNCGMYLYGRLQYLLHDFCFKDFFFFMIFCDQIYLNPTASKFQLWGGMSRKIGMVVAVAETTSLTTVLMFAQPSQGMYVH